YAGADRVITVRAIASGADSAMRWRISTEGAPCRLLILGYLVLGEREHEHRGRVAVDSRLCRFTFRPDPDSLWGQRYPEATSHLVISAPDAVEAIGADQLLDASSTPGSGAYIAIKSRPTREFCFAVVGSLTDSAKAVQLAAKYEGLHDDIDLLEPATQF